MKKQTNVKWKLNELSALAEETEAELDAWVKNLESCSRRTDYKGWIKVKMRRKCAFYYRVQDGKQKYIRRKDESTVRKIIQSQYESNVLQNYTAIRDKLSELIDFLGKRGAEYEGPKIHEELQKFVTPIIESDEDFIRRILQNKPKPMVLDGESHKFLTKNNEFVRSKSELYIANVLHDNNIPYIYEYRLSANGIELRPDFAVIDAKTRSLIAWEHFGLMSDLAYVNRMLEKVETYDKLGYSQLNGNFIYTLESENQAISTTTINKIVNHLKQRVVLFDMDSLESSKSA